MPLRALPFLQWIKGYNFATFRADLISGLTVALVLIPQSMAYAQLAGLKPYYGLYAAFLPPMIASLFGSSCQLATGPVAIVSLMTATALEPLATAGSDAYVAYAVLLALVVGAFQFLLGILKLGMIVNFLSHPVVNGFTNAAALIIASSQLSKLFGVSVDKAEHHYETVYHVVREALYYTHWPTLGLAILAFGIMLALKRINKKIPNVLVAVVVTTLISWLTGFERNSESPIDSISPKEVQETILEFNTTLKEIEHKSEQKVQLTREIEDAEERHGPDSEESITLKHELSIVNLFCRELKEKAGEIRATLRRYHFHAVQQGGDRMRFYLKGTVPPDLETEGRVWRLRVSNQILDMDSIPLFGGGAVVGNIPQGLPAFSFPTIDLRVMLSLFTMAVTISLLGFMEAISIAKAMAAKTGQRLDYNQELVGQGLANIIGSIGQSYPVSGSFSRSAVNLQAGAITGFSNVFSSCVVVVTLLFFTKSLYHLPQAVLAAIIMMAVIGLVNVSGFIHAWQAQKYDGAISITCFVCTLAFAPHLDKGIMIGIVLSLGLYLLRNMKPEIAILSRYTDGTFRNVERLGLRQCPHVAVIRFNGSLFFANVNFLEEKVLERIATMPHLKHVLIVGNGMNELDASGEEMLSSLVTRLRDSGYDISMSGLNDSVLDVMRRTHLYEKIGEDHLFRNATMAVDAIYEMTHAGQPEEECPLLKPRFVGLPVSDTAKHIDQEMMKRP